MDAITKPHECLGRWLKEVPITDVTHCILRYDGVLLVAYCGRTIPLKNASKPVMGARHCTECEILHSRHMKERNAHVASRK